MPHSTLHVASKKRPLAKIKAKPTTAFDKVVLAVSVIYPSSGIPQIIAVFNGKTEGVAILSWILFLMCATLFLIYGLKHKVPPMIVANTLWIAVDLLVVVGILVTGDPITWV